MTYTSIAVFGGTGNIGVPIVHALAADKSLKVTVLTRTESLDKKKDLLDQFRNEGASVVGLEINVESLTVALQGIDLVVSACAMTGYESQKDLIDASKAAGVKRIYLSEYGMNDLENPEVLHPAFTGKQQMRKYATTAGLEVVVYHSGFFLDWLMSPFYSVDHEKKTILVVGNGNEKFAVVTMKNLGLTLTESINHPALASKPGVQQYLLAVNKTVVTWNELIAAHEKVTGTKWQVTFKDADEVQKTLADPSTDIWASFGMFLQLYIAKGWAAPSKSNLNDQFKEKTTLLEEFFN